MPAALEIIAYTPDGLMKLALEFFAVETLLATSLAVLTGTQQAPSLQEHFLR